MNSSNNHSTDASNNNVKNEAHQRACRGGKLGEEVLENAVHSVSNLDEYIHAERMRDFYIESLNVHVFIYQDSIRIVDLTNALRRGAVCISYCVYDHCNDALASNFLQCFGYDMGKAFSFLQTLEFSDRGACEWEGYNIQRNTKKGVNTWSPFPAALANLKPLKEMPKKWTLTHVQRLIVNGQFKDLRRESRYTDDYAYDAATNYGECTISDAYGFIQGIIESPDGWWFYLSDERLKISCHHFNNNSLIVDLDNGPQPPKDEVEEEEGAEAAALQELVEPVEGIQEPSLQSLGLTVTETMTQPTRRGKKPRPVWEVSGEVKKCAEILREAGGRKFRGKYSFWEEPTEAILAAAQEVETLSYAEQVEHDLERAEARAERFSGYADNAESRSNCAVTRSRTLLDPIPLGQPILVGHHSERGHRALLKRADNAMRRAVEEDKKAGYFRSRAAGAAQKLDQVKNPRYINNQIEKFETEIRRLNRILDDCGPDEVERIAKVKGLIAGESEKRNYWRERLQSLDRHLYTKEEINKGDRLKYRGTWYPVVRTNAKTVTVGNWLDVPRFTWKVPYAEIQGVEKNNDAA